MPNSKRFQMDAQWQKGFRELVRAHETMCRHVDACKQAAFWAKDLQARLPIRLRFDADLDTVKERFTCRNCGGRNPTVWSMSTPMDEG